MMVNFKTQDSDTLHTLNNAEKILNKNRIYFLKQKVCGILFVIIGILCPIFFDGDATVSVVVIPLGAYLLFTKERVMNFRM